MRHGRPYYFRERSPTYEWEAEVEFQHDYDGLIPPPEPTWSDTAQSSEPASSDHLYQASEHSDRGSLCSIRPSRFGWRASMCQMTHDRLDIPFLLLVLIDLYQASEHSDRGSSQLTHRNHAGIPPLPPIHMLGCQMGRLRPEDLKNFANHTRSL
jgi:hypothetical protein